MRTHGGIAFAIGRLTRVDVPWGNGQTRGLVGRAPPSGCGVFKFFEGGSNHTAGKPPSPARRL